jgi:hypothetical protein
MQKAARPRAFLTATCFVPTVAFVLSAREGQQVVSTMRPLSCPAVHVATVRAEHAKPIPEGAFHPSQPLTPKDFTHHAMTLHFI